MSIKKFLFLFTPVFFVLVIVTVSLDNKSGISLSANCENNFNGILSRLKINHENPEYETRKIDFWRSYPVMKFSKSSSVFEIEFKNLKTPTRATFTDGRELSFVLEYDEAESCLPKSGVLIHKTFNGDIISRLGRYDCFNKSKIISSEDAWLCEIMNEQESSGGFASENKNSGQGVDEKAAGAGGSNRVRNTVIDAR